ncbi:MAG: hypothetical protein D4R48_03070 [Nitrosomonadales bacterium]|nr:MAG: hypothetical protein D4R48_03070 [Nitrosomonadales bacterium]
MDVLSVASPPSATANRGSAGGTPGFVNTAPTSPAPAAPTAAVSTSADAQGSPSAEHIAQAVKQVNNRFAQQGQNLYGTVDKDKISGVFVFKIMVKGTDEVIRQLPPKEIVAFAQSLEQPQGLRGLLIQATS